MHWTHNVVHTWFDSASAALCYADRCVMTCYGLQRSPTSNDSLAGGANARGKRTGSFCFHMYIISDCTLRGQVMYKLQTF